MVNKIIDFCKRRTIKEGIVIVVVGGLILTIITIVFKTVVGYCLNNIHSLSDVYSWLFKGTKVNNLILTPCIIFTVYALIYFIIKYINNKKTEDKKHWSDYKKDIFFNIEWTWDYIIENEHRRQIIKLDPRCSDCKSPLIIKYDDFYLEKQDYYCDYCEKNLLQGIYEKQFLDKVMRLINQKINSGEWENAL